MAFRAESLLSDFELLDRWRVDIEGAPDEFHDFCQLFVDNGFDSDSRITAFLFALRFRLGKTFGWDEGEKLPIPGCRETSVADRLTDEDRARNRPLKTERKLEGDVIYCFDDEALLEISNKTIHALINLRWVDGAPGKKTVEMAIYIKKRGRMSGVYMALIKPFRHSIVYPALLGRLSRLWRARRSPAA
jgi:hypothetical protein